MKNNLAQLLSNAKAKGVNEGLTAMELCTLVALGNIIDEYLPEDKIPEFLKHTEKEMQEVWQNTVKYMAEEDKNNRSKMRDQNALTVGEYLVGHARRIRERYGMDDEERKDNERSDQQE